jgi:DNA-directed RNA polymerase, mitochondrial
MIDDPELARSEYRVLEKQKADIKRFGYAGTVRGRALVDEHRNRLALAIASYVPTRDYERALLSVLRDLLSDEEIAHVLISAGVEAVTSDWDEYAFQKTMIMFADMLWHQCWGAGLRKYPIGQAEQRVRRLKGGVAGRRTQMRAVARVVNYRSRRWSQALKANAGMWGRNMLLSALADVFWLEGDRLQLSEGAIGLMQARFDDSVRNNPFYFPTTDPPPPWTGATIGGGRWAPRTLVRSYHPAVHAEIREAAKSGQLATALAGVNALKSTAWTINEPIIRFMRTAWDCGIELPGFPRKPGAEPGSRKWKRYSSERAVLEVDVLQHAELLRELGTFYTDLNIDDRGRIVAFPWFNFAREDRVRGLFLFANGARLGGHAGLFWLKAEVAKRADGNTWTTVAKPSEKTFHERYDWTNEHEGVLREIGEAVEDGSIWQWPDSRLVPWLGLLRELDDPFQFLAGCVELAGALRDPDNFVTRLPIMFDGSANGYQHLLAAMRSPQVRYVNLVPNQEPRDLYREIAYPVAGEIRYQIADAPEPIWIKRDMEWDEIGPPPAYDLRKHADALYGMLLSERRILKRPLMTDIYGSTKKGKAKQIFEVFREKGEAYARRHSLPWCSYGLAWQIADRVQDILDRDPDDPAHDPMQWFSPLTDATKARGYLRSMAATAALRGRLLRWTTPSGLPWLNEYHVIRTASLQLYMHDGSAPRRVFADGHEDKVDVAAATRGAAPNFTHACDAAHLMLTAAAVAEVGIPMVSVHDCYGTLAPFADRFRRIVWREFVEMHKRHDVLKEVWLAAYADLGIDLTPPPKRGNLRLEIEPFPEYAFA